VQRAGAEEVQQVQSAEVVHSWCRCRCRGAEVHRCSRDADMEELRC